MLQKTRNAILHLLALPSITVLLATAGPTAKTTAVDGSTPLHADNAVVIVGTVRDANSGVGIEAAQVVLASGAPAAYATANANGHYVLSIEQTTRGSTVALQVRRIGYQARTITVHLVADTVRADVALSASTNSLSSVVVTSVASGQDRHQASPRAAVRPAVQATPAVGPPATERSRKTGGHPDLAGRAGNREQYDRIEDNAFLSAKDNALSTFSIDVDRASYGNMRRFLTAGRLPPKDAVRIEELVNYFPYTLRQPRGRDPIAITTEVAPAPWQPRHHLVRIALQARRIDVEKLPANNLVFLIDVSGSMRSANKLPLVKQSLQLLVEQMREQDHIALVVYAGSAGLVLPSTSGAHKNTIMRAIDRLESGGSTAGGAGLALAYRTAAANFLPEGNNRVILASDGDFNVGPSSDAAMERLVEARRSEGTYLTVLGFGTGNIQDAKMEKMAKIGNGNYAYIDNLREARKTLVREMGATLVTVANDVKVQVEFNPSKVRAYRLIGYENRLLQDEDFTDDKKDAGDIGSGHVVTALYEVVPVGVENTVRMRETDGLRYVKRTATETRSSGRELMFVKLRYKRPGTSRSVLMTEPIRLETIDQTTSDDFRFAASVASFGMLLRDSEHKGSATGADVLRMARGALGADAGGYRAEFVHLVEQWQSISLTAMRSR
jgi:Ca-activated chloride channel family protein